MNITSRDSFGTNTVSRNGNTGLPLGFTPQHGANSGAPAAKKPQEKQQKAKPSSDAPKSAPKQASSPKSSGKTPQKSPLSSEQIHAVLAFCRTYRREIGAAVLALCGIALLLALVSYNPADRANAHVSLSSEQSQTVATPQTTSRTAPATTPQGTDAQAEYVVQNWLGYVGATVAHVIYNYTVGYAALLFPAMMLVWAVALLREKISDRLLLGTSLVLVGAALIASFAGVLQLVPWMPPMRPEWSGSVGQFIARMLWQIIGTVGAFIVLTIGLVATIFVALDLNIEKSITRFKAEKARLSKLKTTTKSHITDAVQEEQAFTNKADNTSNDAASMAEKFTEEILSAKDYDDYHVDMPSASEPGKSPQTTVADDEVLSARVQNINRQSTFADADEPARIMRRAAQSPDVSSLRRDLISKYADGNTLAETNTVQSAFHPSLAEETSVLSAAAAPIEDVSVAPAPATATPVVASPIVAAPSTTPASVASAPTAPAPMEKRVNIGISNTPSMSVSTPQTTVFAQGFSYPAQASITFVETPKAENDLSKKNDELKENAPETPFYGLPKQESFSAETITSPQAAPSLAFSEEELTVHRRNTEHLAGLVAGQVAEEIATQIATEVAGRIVQEVMEKAALEKLAVEKLALEEATLLQAASKQATGDNAAALASMKSLENFITDERSFEDELALESAPILAATPSIVPSIPITIRTNAQSVIPKPMFMPQNDEILREDIHYTPPTLDLLVPQEISDDVSEEELQNNARILQEKLKTFRIEIENLQVTPGPVVTQYEFVPASGVKVSQIENLSDDMALALKARGIRIIAPVPGRGTVAVEIPNARATAVRFSSIVDSAEFEDSQLRLPLALGKTIHGDVFTADLAKMPHLLIAGATGSGKSVGINSIIASLLYKMHPRNLKFVIIDPKRVEMTQYRALANHFLAVCPDIDEKIITDPQNAVIALKSVVAEMTRRYEVLQKVGQRNIVDYNQKIRDGKYKDTTDYIHHEMPYIVVIVDELADLMMTASRDVEEPICRLAQLARAVGIHLIVATQRPSVDVVTGLIKANFPARMAYQVASKIDSRTILDSSGAEHLLGNGDMLFTPGGAGKPMRLQNSYLSTDEVERICEHISDQQGFSQPYMLPSVSEKTQRGGSSGSDDSRDDLFEEAARLVVRHQQCSTSLLQRRMKIGYGRAARIVDQLEDAGIIGAMDGSKGRAVLLDSESALNAVL